MPRPPWIVERALTRPFDPLVRDAALDLGEREAIALAVEIDAWRLVLDDLPARRFAQSLGVRVVGTVGVLLTAKQAGVIASVAPILDALLATGFRLGSDIVAHALDMAGENL
jgi:predicted nucleic acid-binding protein